MAASGTNLFVANNAAWAVGEYTSGAVVNASLVSVENPQAIAVSGSNLFVTYGGSTIGEYTTSGAVVNDSLITGIDSYGIAVVDTPEPSTLALLATGAIGLAGYAWRRRQKPTSVAGGSSGQDETGPAIPSFPSYSESKRRAA